MIRPKCKRYGGKIMRILNILERDDAKPEFALLVAL
jgi:hypothetical protein